jgi:nucleotide-binding universal stress UspA family protein
MKILLAVDGSAHAEEAVQNVTERPWPPGSVVKVISVVQRIVPAAAEFAAAATWSDVWETQTDQAEQLTARVAQALTAGGLTVETVVRQGDPRTEIIGEAKNWGADLIVLGAHGHSRLERLLLGSVAHSVMNHSPCSVEIVRRRQG